MAARTLLVAFEASEAWILTGFAAQLGLPFDAIVLSGDPRTDLGAEKLFTAGLTEIPPADSMARGLLSLCERYTHIAAVSSMRSKDILARLASLLVAAMVTDVVGIESPSVFKRPMLAGSVIATTEVLQLPVVMTVRPANFPPRAGSPASLESIEISAQSNVKVLDRRARGGSRPDLTQAKVVVSGGRPLKDAETFERVIGGLADALGGAVGATRAAVDSGIAGNELQVGQTGKIVAPDLYIAAGISGSTQHMAGIKDSKLIVAINKDPDAPIFQSADLGLVADLFDALPALQSRLKD
jgi:electron transfer flavoprotein alpha subunit